MGGGAWTSSSFRDYSTSVGRTLNLDCTIDTSNMRSVQDIYTVNSLDSEMSPYNIVRECCDSTEHPYTKPVILGVDVTGSMGPAAMQVAKALGPMMSKLYESIDDIEFCVMGIGDLDYDRAPIQMSQFESDVRIAKYLDKIYFEAGGGGNSFESYTAAWYMGLNHCKLDCWERGEKGVIITIGDEPINPYLPKSKLEAHTGDEIQADIETKDLYRRVSEKFNVYHIHVLHGNSGYDIESVTKGYASVIGKQNFHVCNVEKFSDTIIEILTQWNQGSKRYVGGESDSTTATVSNDGYISW